MSVSKNNQKTIIVSLIVVAIIIVIALIYNVISLCVTLSKVNKLEQNIADLDKLIAQNSEEIAYRDTDEYIRKYAQEYLNMKNNGDIIFVGK